MTAVAEVTAAKPKHSPSKWTRVVSSLRKGIETALGLEQTGWMAVADALAVAKDEFDGQLLSFSDDFLPFAAAAIRKSEESVKTYLNARACFKSTPRVPLGCGKEALNQLWQVKDVAARVEILEQTGGDTVSTRKAVKAYKLAQLTPDQRTAKLERAANRHAKQVETAVTAVSAEIHPILDRVRENPPASFPDQVDLIAEVYRLGCERDPIAAEALDVVIGNWYSEDAANREASAGIDSRK